MIRIILQDDVRTQLDGLSEPAELCDQAGRTMGHFVPSTAMGARDNCPYSIAELEQMRSEQGGRPLPEIWQSLGAN
jgi:hypothetical protein